MIGRMMRVKSRVRKRWHFSASVLAPVIFSLLVTGACVLGFVLWSTANADRQALQRQMQMVAHILADQLKAVPHAQESVAVQDAAVVNTSINFNPRWIEQNLGLRMHEYFGHDRSFVLNADDIPIYAMNAGATISPSVYSSDYLALAPLVARMRQLIADGNLEAYRKGQIAEVPRLVDLVQISGLPAIVSVFPLISNSSYRLQEPGKEFLHISVVLLDTDLAEKLADQYLLTKAGFSLEQSHESGMAVYPMMNSFGRFVAFFQWEEDRPGARMLGETVPVLIVGFLVGGILVFLLLDKLWRSTMALESGRHEAQYQALHDALTSLPNRAMFDMTLRQAILDLGQSNKTLTLFMLDLDRFKQVNDTRGHQAGDILIQAVARRLDAFIERPSVICRIGGDEFALICVHCAEEHHACSTASALIELIDKPFDVAGSEVFIGVSIGISMTRDPNAERSELVREADIALYEAKAGGRNRAVAYRQQMSELLQFRHTIEEELREALKHNDQLSVVFQPLVSANGRICGLEVLSRWRHPALGHISPADFIPVAESTGLIEILGEAVLRKTCQVGARWPGLTLAVNISPTQLRNPAFSRKVFELLAATGMRAEDLELEITEGILLEDETVTSETLRKFRAAGIKIALDDFGTGYSSLNYLKQYAVDRIKIDRSFINQLADGGVSVAIVQAMVTLAHAMGIEVTAEGVETAEQRDVLAAMGCNTFQGYFFSPPTDLSKVEPMLAQSASAVIRRSHVA
jgi:diguanylate cyclase (GGDEF)-like protein